MRSPNSSPSLLHEGVGRIVAVGIGGDVLFQRELEAAKIDLVGAEALDDVERLGAHGIAQDDIGRVLGPIEAVPVGRRAVGFLVVFAVDPACAED